MPPFPDGCEYLWEWFCDMRTMNGDDFSAGAVQAWFSLNGIQPEPWEVQAVCGVWLVLVKSRATD